MNNGIIGKPKIFYKTGEGWVVNYVTEYKAQLFGK
jgi:hypothetical protein